MTSTFGHSRGPADRDVEHDAPLVVLLVAKAAADPLHLLDDAVEPLGPGVGDAQLEEALDLRPLGLHGGRQPVGLRHRGGRP